MKVKTSKSSSEAQSVPQCFRLHLLTQQNPHFPYGAYCSFQPAEQWVGSPLCTEPPWAQSYSNSYRKLALISKWLQVPITELALIHTHHLKPWQHLTLKFSSWFDQRAEKHRPRFEPRFNIYVCDEQKSLKMLLENCWPSTATSCLASAFRMDFPSVIAGSTKCWFPLGCWSWEQDLGPLRGDRKNNFIYSFWKNCGTCSLICQFPFS